MMTSSSGSNGNWDRWVAHRIGGLEVGQNNLQRTIENTRQDAFRDLWHVRRELLGRIAPLERKRGRADWAWLRHIPWVHLTVLLILAILVATGVITGAELKAWALRKITDL